MKSPCDSQLLVKGTLHIPQQQRLSRPTEQDVGEEEQELSMKVWNFPHTSDIVL